MVFLFLCQLVLVRNAQNEINRNSDDTSVFQFQGNSVNSKIENNNQINNQRLIDILEGGVTEWSFVEAMLQEPNVDLGKSEVFVPLKRLTTTLEVLGNIFFSHNDLENAVQTLERACPLMELLNEAALSGAAHAEMPSAIDSIQFIDQFSKAGSAGGGGGGGGKAQVDAAGCFNLLRIIYKKQYRRTIESAENNPTVLFSSSSVSPTPISKDMNPSSSSSGMGNSLDTGHKPHLNSNPSSAGSHQSHNKFLLPNGKSRENNLKYVLSQRQQRQKLIQTRSTKLNAHDIGQSTPTGYETNETADSVQNETDLNENSFDSTRHRRRDHSLLLREDTESLYSDNDDFVPFDIEKKLLELRAPFNHLRSGVIQPNDKDNLAGTTGAVDIPVRDSAEGDQSSSTTESRKLTSIPSESSDQPATEISKIPPKPPATPPSATTTSRENSRTPRPGVGLGLSGGSERVKEGESGRVVGFEGSVLNSLSGSAITVPGVSSIIIADDLEQLLRKFVRASKKHRKKLAQQAAKYFDELDINFPNMDYNEYAANMDVGQAYLEVMGRAADEGFGFIEQELNSWKLAGVPSDQRQAYAEDNEEVSRQHSATMRTQETAPHPSALQVSYPFSRSRDTTSAAFSKTTSLSSKRLNGIHIDPSDAVIEALEEKYGLQRLKDDASAAIEASRDDKANKKSSKTNNSNPRAALESAPNLTMAEKNRLMVLYAFDIVNMDPTDPFIVALGFNEGIAANDRSKRSGGDLSVKSSEALNQAVASLRDVLRSIEGGVLANSEDAHRRLFGEYSSNDWGVQAAEQFLSAKREALRAQVDVTKSSRDPSVEATSRSESNTQTKSSKRRRQRLQPVGGQGEYSVSSDAGIDPFSPTASKIHSDSSAFDSFFIEESVGSSGIFSSSPSFTSSESTDLLLAIFFLFLAAVLVWVYLTNQDAARKRMAVSRNRIRPGAGLNSSSSSSRKSSSSSQWLSGTWIVDFMYAQLGGVGGAPGADATADWDDEGLALSAAAENMRSSAHIGNNITPNSQDSYASKASVPNKSKRGNKDSTPASYSESTSTTTTTAISSAIPSLLGDLFSLLKPAAAVKDLSLHADVSDASSNNTIGGSGGACVGEQHSGKRKDSPRTDHPNEFATRPSHPGASHSGALHTSPIGSGGSGGSAGKKKAKGKDASASARNNTNKAPPAISPNNSSSCNNTSSTSVRRSAPSSDSLNSASSASSTSSNKDEETSFAPPLVLNNRKVSWAGLIPNSTTTTTTPAGSAGVLNAEASAAPSSWYSTSDARAGAGAGIDDPGDWAEARKKGGRHKHSANDEASSTAVKPERIALTLKESPLYRSPAQRATTNKLPVNKPASAVPQGQSGLLQKMQPTPAAVRTEHVPSAAEKKATSNKAEIHVYGSGAKPATNAPASALYALSDAKLIAEKQGGWSVGNSNAYYNNSIAGAEGINSVPPPGLVAAASTGASSTPRNSTLTSPQISNQVSPSMSAGKQLFPPLPPSTTGVLSPPANAGSSRTAFGFSQFDINRTSSSSQPAYSALWSTVSVNQSPARSGTGGTGGTGAAGAIGGDGIEGESPSDLPTGLVDFLDSSPRNSPLPPTHINSGAGGGGSVGTQNSRIYSTGYDFSGLSQLSSGSEYFRPQDRSDRRLQQQDQNNADYFSPFGNSFGKYNHDSLSDDLRSRYGSATGPGGLGGGGTGVPAGAGGGGAGDLSGWYLSADRMQGNRASTSAASPFNMSTNITHEASAVYGLSPDAPSFQPSQLRSHNQQNPQPQLSPQAALPSASLYMSDLSPLSGATQRYNFLDQQNGGDSGSTPLYVSDDYYESFLIPGIDSILGGADDQMDHSKKENKKDNESARGARDIGAGAGVGGVLMDWEIDLGVELEK